MIYLILGLLLMMTILFFEPSLPARIVFGKENYSKQKQYAKTDLLCRAIAVVGIAAIFMMHSILGV